MPDTIFYAKRQNIPVIAETDLLVVGTGPGGLGAAVMAARQGIRVAAAERYGCPGGMATFGEVTPFSPNHLDGRSMDRPVYVDWCRQMWSYRPEAYKLAHPFQEDCAPGALSKDEAILAMEDLMLESGVRLFYHHTLCDVIVESGKIQAAVFQTKSGLCAIRAKIFVDSTGDGDLAALAGCPVEFGNQSGFCQPMTTCFKLGNVDTAKMPSAAEINAIYQQSARDGLIGCPRETLLWFRSLEGNVIHFNTTRIIKKSGIDGQELSAAEIEGRRQARIFIEFLRKYIPGFAQATLYSLAHHVGVRESRRIIGQVCQTAADFTDMAKYPDGVVRCNYPIDIHDPSGAGTTMKRMAPGQWFELRYGTIVPRNCGNLLMGCRAISVDHELHSSMRVMPVVCSIGQAAGMAGALCVRQGFSPAELDGKILRKALISAGAELE